MFRKKKNRPQPVPNQHMETIIGAGTHFTGTLRAQGSLRIDGRVDGQVHAQGDVVVGENGRVEANVKAQNLTVAGEVHGDAEVDGTLEIAPSGQLLGDVQVVNLVVHEGSGYQGTCKMQVEPSEETSKQLTTPVEEA